jgi:tRNA1(Val) A37 N6-methylase TrmN6
MEPSAHDWGELTDDAITDSYRLWQRRDGHRYSTDDVTTAWEAVHAVQSPRRCLDLGCGIGSVLHIVAYRFPESEIVGIEAQEVSHALAMRNVERNGLSHRVTLVRGDLRDFDGAGRFDLVTGTPPYFRIGTSVPSADSQRMHARVEVRGGVEDYVRAGARALADGGRLVVCADARTPERVIETAPIHGLRVVRRRDVVPRAGSKPPLFTVWTLAHERDGGTCETMVPWVVLDERGVLTRAGRELRSFVGMPYPDAS